jgi:hypothetical protein
MSRVSSAQFAYCACACGAPPAAAPTLTPTPPVICDGARTNACAGGSHAAQISLTTRARAVGSSPERTHSFDAHGPPSRPPHPANGVAARAALVCRPVKAPGRNGVVRASIRSGCVVTTKQ